MSNVDKSSLKGSAFHEDTIFQIQLPFLQYLKKVMQPHQKQFNIIDFFELILAYCMKLPNQTFEASILQLYNPNQSEQEQIRQSSNSTPESQKARKISMQKIQQQQMTAQINQRKMKCAEQLLDKLKKTFLWYKKNQISFQMLNNYILSCQNRILKQANSLQNLSQYQNLPQRRIRLDENVKLCIMPQGDSSKIKFLTINPSEQNRQDIYRKQIYIVTSEYVRSIKVDAQKLSKEGNKTIKSSNDKQKQQNSKISIVKNWYEFSDLKIMPESLKHNEKDMKINSKKQIYIDKISMSDNLIGIITHEKDVLIKPLLKESQMYQRGRKVVPYQIKMGNLISDIPDENLEQPLTKDKAKLQQLQKSQNLLFQCYGDDIWIIVNEHFIFIYLLPSPDKNAIINDQQEKSSLLSLCEPLPTRAVQAKLLTKEYLVIMLQSPCILILKLQLSSKKQERQKNRIYPTNKVYNDIKFICMDYHPIEKCLLFTDFGGYIVRLKFNIASGDIQREGTVYDEETGKFLTQNTTNTRRDKQFSILQRQSEINIQNSLMNHFSKEQISKIVSTQAKKSSSKSQVDKQTLTIWEKKGRSLNQLVKNQFQIGSHKANGNQGSGDRSGMSIYSKPQNTGHMKIVQNSSRQNMILLCLNKNTSTIITYQEISVNPLKNGKPDDTNDSDKDRLYDKAIRLWDLNYMTVYQTFTLSLQITDMSLQSNGLYIVTKQRGYLGFYPFLNKETQHEPTKKEKQTQKENQLMLRQNVIVNGGQIFFCAQLQKEKKYEKIQKQGYQNHLINYNNSVTTIYNFSFSQLNPCVVNLQQIPSQITKIQVQNKLYVLSDTNGDKKYNLHIYDTLGNKQSILKGITKTPKYGILENYSNIKKINHFQFNILMWNKHSLKFIGTNLQESSTIHWTFSCKERLNRTVNSQFDLRSLKSSVSKKQKSIEDMYVGENCIGIQEKLQNDIFRHVSLSILHLQSGRIKYRVNDIQSSFKVLTIYNNILLTHETQYQKSATSTLVDQLQTGRNSNKKASYKLETSQSSIPSNQDQQIINLYDMNSPMTRKCIYSLKFKSLIQKNMTILQIKQYCKDFNSAINQERFYDQKKISLQAGRFFSLNKYQNIVISCIFKVNHQLLQIKHPQNKSLHSVKVLDSSEQYILYCRQISSQIWEKLKYTPRTSDANITKISKKVNFQYMGQTQAHQRVVGHWEVDLQELMSRSTTKNFNYITDFHYDNDPDVPIILQDITQKIIKFCEPDKNHQNNLSSNEKFIKIVEKSSKQEQNLNIQWIQAENQSSKSLLSLQRHNFLEIFSQQTNYLNGNNDKVLKIQVSLNKICRIQTNSFQRPIITFWNCEFDKQNQKIWQQTKQRMVQYVKQKLSKETQKHLNSPSNIHRKGSNLQNKNTLIRLKQSSNATQQSENIENLSKQSKVQVSPTQLNSMFRQWHISKNIEKEMKNYENNANQKRKQLDSELKHIIQSPYLKQERIKYLLAFPQKIKDPRLFNAFQVITKKLDFLNASKDIMSIFDKKLQHDKSLDKHVSNDTNQGQDNFEQSLQKKLKYSLQNSIQLPKISRSQFELKQKSISKGSELKISKQNQKRQIKSQLSTHNYGLVSPKKEAFNKGHESLSKRQITRTKTQMTQNHYMDSIAQTPLLSLLAFQRSQIVNKSSTKEIRISNTEQSFSKIKNRQNPSKKKTNPQNNPQNYNQPKEFQKSPTIKSKSQVTRCRTQASRSEQNLGTVSDEAILQLKKSTKIITQSVLPQIKINRQTLNQKMKQKKSFLKSINERLCFNKEQIKEQILNKEKSISSFFLKKTHQ